MVGEYLNHSNRHRISHFEPNSILRGVQLTFVGAFRALQNPSLLTSQHYKQVTIAIAGGIAIRIILSIPETFSIFSLTQLFFYIVKVLGAKVFLWTLSYIFNFEYASWTYHLINDLTFIQDYVLQVPFLLMTLMGYITPTLDEMFMESLAWVDSTYYKKHEAENPESLRSIYYQNLCKYSTRGGYDHESSTSSKLKKLITRSTRKALVTFTIFLISYTPVFGRFVLPSVSFYTFQKVTGLAPASLIFGIGIFLPRTFLVIFLQSYFASRNLMRELLEPYFCRIHFTKLQKENWFHDREGLLFGFGIGFYLLTRIPFLGVLIYGIAEASTAYLITKITDPPPPPDQCEGFAANQQHWSNKTEFLRLRFREIDKRLHSK